MHAPQTHKSPNEAKTTKQNSNKIKKTTCTSQEDLPNNEKMDNVHWDNIRDFKNRSLGR